MRMIMFTHYEQFYFTDRLFVNKSTVHLHSYVPNLSTHHSYVPNLLKNMSAVWNYLQRYGMRQTQQKNLKSTMHKWVISLTPYIYSVQYHMLHHWSHVTIWSTQPDFQTPQCCYNLCSVHSVHTHSHRLLQRNGMDKSRGGSVRPGYDQVYLGVTMETNPTYMVHIIRCLQQTTQIKSLLIPADGNWHGSKAISHSHFSHGTHTSSSLSCPSAASSLNWLSVFRTTGILYLTGKAIMHDLWATLQWWHSGLVTQEQNQWSQQQTKH